MYDLSGSLLYTEYYLVIEQFRERLPASKLVAKKLNVERFSLKKLSELGVRKE